MEFVREFKEQNQGHTIETKNIFLLCDRDLLPLTQIDNTDLSVNINNAYNDFKTVGTTKTYLHSWRMLEIENYLLSRTMLDYYGKFEDFKNSRQRMIKNKTLRSIVLYDLDNDIF